MFKKINKMFINKMSELIECQVISEAGDYLKNIPI